MVVSFVTMKKFWLHSMLVFPLTDFINVSSVIKRNQIIKQNIFVCLFVIKFIEKTRNFGIYFSIARSPKICWPIKKRNCFQVKSATKYTYLLYLFKFLRWSLIIFITSIIQTIVFILIVIFRTFLPMRPSFASCWTREHTHNFELIHLFNPLG